MEDWKLRLKQSRENKELNKTTFAKAVGVSNATVTDWEKGVGEGGIKELSGTSLVKIHEVLGVDLYWLLSGKSSGGRPSSADAPTLASSDTHAQASGTSVELEARSETAVADMLQWVSSKEATLLTDFRTLTAQQQESLMEFAQSFPRRRQSRPRVDQR